MENSSSCGALELRCNFAKLVSVASRRRGPRGGASDREGGGSSLCADVIFLFLGCFFFEKRKRKSFATVGHNQAAVV